MHVWGVRQNGGRQTDFVGKVAVGESTIRRTVGGEMAVGELTWYLARLNFIKKLIITKDKSI